MDRDTLARILERAPGVEGKDGTYEVADDHRLTLYIGKPAAAMELGDVVRCTLQETFAELVTRKQDTVFVTYESVHGAGVQPVRGASGRAGFA